MDRSPCTTARKRSDSSYSGRASWTCGNKACLEVSGGEDFQAGGEGESEVPRAGPGARARASQGKSQGPGATGEGLCEPGSHLPEDFQARLGVNAGKTRGEGRRSTINWRGESGRGVGGTWVCGCVVRASVGRHVWQGLFMLSAVRERVGVPGCGRGHLSRLPRLSRLPMRAQGARTARLFMASAVTASTCECDCNLAAISCGTGREEDGWVINMSQVLLKQGQL